MLVLLIIPVSIVFGQDTQVEKWNLEECIEYALDNNLSVKQSEFSVSDSEVLLRQSKGGMYPSANMGGGYTNLWGRSIDPTTNLFSNQRIQSLGLQLSANYTLYGGSQNRNSVKQNRLNLTSATFDLEKVRNDIMLNVTLEFLTVVLNNELLENAKLQLEITKAYMELGHLSISGTGDCEKTE